VSASPSLLTGLDASDLGRLARFPDWLAAVADPVRARAALARTMPGLAACEVVRVRIKEDGCTARYRVTLGRGPAAREADLVARVDPPEPGAAEARLRPAEAATDSALPALGALLEPGPAARLLEDALGGPAGPFPGYRVTACAPTVTRYKPGSRCTVVYRLELPDGAPGAWPRGVVGKTYHAGKGAVAWSAMRDLWNSGVRERGGVALAEPLAFLPEQRVLLQRVIPHERTLKDALRASLPAGAADDGLTEQLAAAARGLAALHGSGVPALQSRTWDDELAEAREVLDRLGELVPELTGAGAGLLRRLETIAVEHPAPPAVPSHGSFRPAQVVIDSAGGIGFIDFDSFCRSEPALDVALFCSSLADSGLRSLAAATGDTRRPEHFQLLDGLCERFLSAYEAEAPLDRARVALWWTLDALTGVLHCWTKVKADRLDYRMALLEDALRRPEAVR
jgi:phosphotransferase family enzyme